MSQRPAIALAITISLLVSGCATNGPGERQATGAGVGCLVGAVLGAALLKNKGEGLALGCVAGGAVGFGIGTVLDDREKRELAEASYRAAARARTGQRVAWGGTNNDQESTSSNNASYGNETTPSAPTPRPHKKKKKPDIAANITPPSQHSASGWVIPVNDPYRTASGATCRDLQQVAMKDGKTYSQNVQACDRGSGWVVPEA